MADFTNSPFIFTAPVRKYKANDPYYWEIDNIPLKQLQENCNWLKSQLGGTPGTETTGPITRAQLDELRPFVDGLPGRKVFVNPKNKTIGSICFLKFYKPRFNSKSKNSIY